jgi:hypothetical protein
MTGGSFRMVVASVLLLVSPALLEPEVSFLANGVRTLTEAETTARVGGAFWEACPGPPIACPTLAAPGNNCSGKTPMAACLGSDCYGCSLAAAYNPCVSTPYSFCNADNSGNSPCGFEASQTCTWVVVAPPGTSYCTCFPAPVPGPFTGTSCRKSHCTNL